MSGFLVSFFDMISFGQIQLVQRPMARKEETPGLQATSV